jgi:hypothetical protein
MHQDGPENEPASSIDPALGIGLAVVLGFIVHQTFRTVFELFGGFASRLRPVIREIRNDADCSPFDAFLVWELALYSDKVKDAFREHDRNAWHYIMSFWATAFSAVLGGGIVGLSDAPVAAGYAWAFVGVAVVFLVKGFLTARSISQAQEKIGADHGTGHCLDHRDPSW